MNAESDATSGDLNELQHAVSLLISAVTSVLAGDHDGAHARAIEASRSLELTLTAGHPVMGDASRFPMAYRSGLAPWQIRRVLTHIDVKLGEAISCEDLSDLVKLSVSHLSRAFRTTFGCPPHAYVIRRRLERAQGLMLTTGMSLGEIAHECGFADQAHMSKLFQRNFKESPSVWRRARVNPSNPIEQYVGSKHQVITSKRSVADQQHPF